MLPLREESCGVAGCNVWLSRFFSCLVHPAASRSHFGLGPVSALPCSCSPSNLPMSDLQFHTDDAIGVSLEGILAATVTPACGTAEARSHVELNAAELQKMAAERLEKRAARGRQRQETRCLEIREVTAEMKCLLAT